MYRYHAAAVAYIGPRAVAKPRPRRKIKLRKRAVRRVKLLAAALFNLVFYAVCIYAVIFALMAMVVFLG